MQAADVPSDEQEQVLHLFLNVEPGRQTRFAVVASVPTVNVNENHSKKVHFVRKYKLFILVADPGGHALSVHAIVVPSFEHLQSLHSTLKKVFGSQTFFAVVDSIPDGGVAVIGISMIIVYKYQADFDRFEF